MATGPQQVAPGDRKNEPVSSGPLAPGQTVLHGAFRVTAAFGPDVFGAAYRGERVEDGKAVLLHAVPSDLAPPTAVGAGLVALRGLSHRGLAPVLDAGVEGALLIICSDAPSGPSLRQMIEKKRRSQGQPLSYKGASNIVEQVAAGLAALHGVRAHGLLCPELIEIDASGNARLVGLALSALVPPTTLAWTYPESAGCMAPERRVGGPATAAADVYALGAVFYTCVTGRPTPLDGTADPGYIPASQLYRELPGMLDDVLACCLAADPALRFQDPLALTEALAMATTGGPKSTLSVPIAAFQARSAAAPRRPEPPPAAPPAAVGRAAPDVNAPNPAGLAAPQSPQANMADSPPKGPPRPLEGFPGPRTSGAVPQVPGRVSGGFPLPPPPLAPLGPSGPVAVGGDEDAERWLIQKEDKMDYGPFPMREVRDQIERGSITAEHFIKDMETGDRRRVREHPLLADFAREWEAKHAQLALELKDRADRDKHRASVQKALSGIFIVVLLVGVGVGGYFKFVYKPEVKTVVVKEQSNDDFFKGIQISMNVDPPKKKVPGTRKKGPKNGAFDSTTSMDAAEDGGDETLSGSQVSDVMNKNFKLLGGCLREEAQRNPSVRKLDLEFLIRGSTGKVFSVKVNNETGSTVASCVFAKMQAVDFPKFNGAKTHATFSLALR